MSEDIAGYRVLEKAGEGGFSVVYRAYQERLDRQVALKVLSVSSVDDQAMRRFQRECKITGRLSGHPNVVTVLDVGTTKSDRPYIAMEYFEHGSLTDRLAKEGPLPVPDVLRVGVKMAGALAATHEIDVLHRDVKPQNILVSRYGEPALADFGIARLVDNLESTHTTAFTPHHAAPEILEGRPPGVPADLYSLGSTLYQLLAGKAAFRGPQNEGIAALMLRILHDPPPPIARPDLPPALFEVIQQAMAKDPGRRFPDAVTFAQRLQQVQAELGLPVTDLAHSGAAGAVAVAAAPPSQEALPPPPPVAEPAWPDTSAPVDLPGAPPADGWPAPGVWPDQVSPLSAPPAPPVNAPPLAAPVPVPVPMPTPAVAVNTTPPMPGNLAAWPVTPGEATYAPARNHAHAEATTQPRPAAPAQPVWNQQAVPRRRRGLLVAGAVAVVGGLGLGTAGVVLLTGNSGGAQPTAAPTTPQAATRAAPNPAGGQRLTPAEIGAARPRSVTVTRIDADSVRLRWRLLKNNRYPLFITREDGSPPVTLHFGTTTTVINRLAPGTRHCFTVAALLTLSPPQYAKAKPVCTR